MARSPGPPVVAVLNTNDDIVELLRMKFEMAGLIAVSAHLDDVRRGQVSLVDFVKEHEPDVVLFDVAPPYEQYWRYLQHVRGMKEMAGRRFVVTTTNERRLREMIDTGEPVFEIVGKPYDLDQLTDIVRQASRARPVK